ncbi:MAG: 30S ribosomal protein S13 [Dehalococcoidia bacterium]
MVRVAGVDIPDSKRVDVALQRIYGIGHTVAKRIVQEAELEELPKMRELSEAQLNRVRQLVESRYKVEGDLRREVAMNIRRLIDIGSYRGLRHRRGLPVRGQRTRTNSRTRKGPKRTVAGRGRRTGMKK